MSIYCVFDVETTGLPKKTSTGGYFHYAEYEKYDQARVVSLAWSIFEGRALLRSRYAMVKPDGFKIDPKSKATGIHGIEHEFAGAFGVPLTGLLEQFIDDLNTCDTLVAHNIKFDVNVVAAEMSRLGRQDLLSTLEGINRRCTMEQGKNFTPSGKRPRLGDLFKHFTGSDFENKHHAVADVNACAECFQLMNNL